MSMFSRSFVTLWHYNTYLLERIRGHNRGLMENVRSCAFSRLLCVQLHHHPPCILPTMQLSLPQQLALLLCRDTASRLEWLLATLQASLASLRARASIAGALRG